MTDWTDFVKKVMKRDGISYKEALKKASGEYKKKAREKVTGAPSKGMARKGQPKGSRLAYDDTGEKKGKKDKKM